MKRKFSANTPRCTAVIPTHSATFTTVFADAEQLMIVSNQYLVAGCSKITEQDCRFLVLRGSCKSDKNRWFFSALDWHNRAGSETGNCSSWKIQRPMR